MPTLRSSNLSNNISVPFPACPLWVEWVLVVVGPDGAAGGAAGALHVEEEPTLELRLEPLHLRIEAPVAYHVGLRLFRPPPLAAAESSEGATEKSAAGRAKILPRRVGRMSKGEVQVASSGDYRQGFCFFEVGINADEKSRMKPTPPLPAGVYVLVVSTFDPGQVGGFVLTAEVTCSGARLEPLPAA